MPRQGRINIEGAIYHVIQRGLERKEIFRDDADREEFLRRLSEGLKATKHKCYGWALMPNHFHLIIRTSARHISDLMRKLLTGYALYFNKKYKRSGYLYQGRYKSILCQEDNYLLELIRYIHLNAIRARIVKDMNEMRGYRWSGHSVLMGKIKAEWQSIDEILAYFGKKKFEAIKKYEEFVAEAKEMPRRDDLTGGGLIRSAGGWKEVVSLRHSKEKWVADERILGDGDFVERIIKQSDQNIEKQSKLKREGWTFDKLIDNVVEKYQISRKDLKRKGRKNKLSEAKAVLSYYANKYLGITGSEISKTFACKRSAVNRLIHLGEKHIDLNRIKALF